MRRLTLTLLIPVATMALAEMGGEDYASDRVLTDPAERQRIQEEIEAERQAEARRESLRIETERVEQTRIEAERARRPYARRLMDERCARCHNVDTLAGVTHTRAGWYLTITRMRWWNGADLTREEALAITAYLSERQPAGGSRSALEYTLIVTPVAAAIYGGIHWHRRRRRS